MDEELVNTKNRLHKFLEEEISLFFEKSRFDANPEITIKNVSQIILWVCALDEFYKKSDGDNYSNFLKGKSSSEILKGVRYARNRAIHQFTQLLYISAGAELPATLPFPLFEIRWKSVNELPSPDKGYKNKELENHYLTHLENKAVKYTFESLKVLFEQIKLEI
jgi:hypothetical protein